MKEADSNDSLPQNTENNTNTSSKLPKSISNIINPDDRSSYIDYLIKTPLFTCLICILTVLFYILSFFFPEFILKLTNIPEFTINKFHVWSLITSFMVSLNFQNWIFPFVIWIPEGRTLERELGTLKYIINFCVNSLIIQIMFLIVSFIFSLFIDKLWEVPSCGIMPAVLAEITILSFANPNNLVTFLKIPLDFRAIYYPFILFFVFLLINLFCFKIDALCGLIFGIIFFYYLRPYLVISNDLILKIESCFPLNYIKQLPNYIGLPASESRIGFSSINLKQNLENVIIPNSPSNILALNVSKSSKPNIPCERLDVSEENKEESSSNKKKIIKYTNINTID